jgi:hypothetical protein
MKLSDQMTAFIEGAFPDGAEFPLGQMNATRKWLPLVRELEVGAPSRSDVQAFARFLVWLLGIEVAAETIAVHVERGEGTATITLEVDEQHLSCTVQRTQRLESKQDLNVNDWGYWA